jgi:precorrin-3B C17-methyltransferase
MGIKKFAVTPGFGVGGTLFRPEQLSTLGSIVGEEAKIELTNFNQLYVAMEEDRIEEVQEKLKETGLEIHPAGFYTKSLIACNFCRGAEEAGLDVVKDLNGAIAGHEVPSPLKIGYAGCELGTSEPLLKDIGVIKMKEAFDIYVGGDPKSLKAKLAEPLVQGITEEQLIPTVLRLIRHYQQHGKKKEKYARSVKRLTIEKLREAVA